MVVKPHHTTIQQLINNEIHSGHGTGHLDTISILKKTLYTILKLERERE